MADIDEKDVARRRRSTTGILLRSDKLDNGAVELCSLHSISGNTSFLYIHTMRKRVFGMTRERVDRRTYSIPIECTRNFISQVAGTAFPASMVDKCDERVDIGSASSAASNDLVLYDRDWFLEKKCMRDDLKDNIVKHTSSPFRLR